MIIFVDGFNDFYEFDENHDQFASYAYQEHSDVIMGEPTLYSLGYTNMWWLYRKSAFAHLTFRTLRDLKRTFTPRPEPISIDVGETLPHLRTVFSNNALKMLERLALILRSEDVEGIFVLQPMLILERERAMPPIERKLFEFNVDSWVPNYEAFSHEAVKLVASLTRKTVERHDAHFVDSTRVFTNAEGQIFTDYAHLTPLGNQILARHIAEYVIPIVRNVPATRKLEPLNETTTMSSQNPAD